MSLSGGLTGANKIDDTRWEHQRLEVDSTPSGVEPSISLHYIECPPPPSQSPSPKGTILLVHGFPQTSYQFRRVITPLSDAGYRVIAPDYRGAGDSTKPWNGYTKDVMARDLRNLMEKLDVKDKVHLVGHDIGGMIVHAYATLYPEATASVTWGECPLPGSTFYHNTKNSPLVWHFTFHAVPDLPEALVQGREKIYLKHFFERLGQNPAAISNHDLDVYATAYAQPGAMRCGFNVYRTFETDGEMNVGWVREKGKSKVRCLALWGEKSFAGEKEAVEMAGEFYEDVEFGSVGKAGHWIAEERPGEFVDAVLRWIGRG